MFSLSSNNFHRPTVFCRRQEPMFGFCSDQWLNLSNDRFILRNYEQNALPIYFLRIPLEKKTNFCKQTKDVVRENSCGSLSCRKEEDNFHVVFNLADFEPNEIDLSLDSNRLKIHAKSDSTDGTTSECFKWYSLPENIEFDKLTSSLSKDGKLHVRAPFKKSKKSSVDENLKHDSFDQLATDTVDQEQFKYVEKREESTEPTDVEGNNVCQTTSMQTEINDSDFHVELPMIHFKPEHVIISLEDNKLKIHAKKIDETGGNFVHEEVTKWFNLPSDIDATQLRSTIRDDGILVVNAPSSAKLNTDDNTSKDSDDTEHMGTDIDATDKTSEL